MTCHIIFEQNFEDEDFYIANGENTILIWSIKKGIFK